MVKDFCPKCGKKEFEFIKACFSKRKCKACNYFLYDEDFKELKKGKLKE